MKTLAIILLCCVSVIFVIALILAVLAWNDVNAILDGMRDDPWMIDK